MTLNPLEWVRSDPDADDTPTADVDVDVLLDALANPRRRHALRVVAGLDDLVAIDTLAEIMAAAEQNKSVHEISHDERKRVYVTLYQCHLPTLDEAGLVDTRSGKQVIAPTEGTRAAVEVIDAAAEHAADDADEVPTEMPEVVTDGGRIDLGEVTDVSVVDVEGDATLILQGTDGEVAVEVPPNHVQPFAEAVGDLGIVARPRRRGRAQGGVD